MTLNEEQPRIAVNDYSVSWLRVFDPERANGVAAISMVRDGERAFRRDGETTKTVKAAGLRTPLAISDDMSRIIRREERAARVRLPV